METLILTESGLEKAAEIIKCGGLAAVPTETVYGLACDGMNEKAVEEIYTVKGRPETKPINLLVPDMKCVEGLCREIPASAYILAERFWPGPLTMILRKKDTVPGIVTAYGETVGVRCPDHPLTLKLLKMCKTPFAAPSANISGMPSPKCAFDVLKYFDGKIPCVVDGGVCSVGIESTIVDLTADTPKILRMGGLSREDIENALEMKVEI